jgi:hypothetical protein
MKIARSPEIKKQISLARDLKKRIIQEIDSRIEVLEKSNAVAEGLRSLRDEIESVSEAFSVNFKTVPYAKVNRRKSMLSGPFFVSKDFPVPVGVSRAMYPLVQLEMSVLSKVVGENLGGGLFQLWYDIDADKELIRVVPDGAILCQELIEFTILQLSDDYLFPIPSWMDLDPFQNGVKVVESVISCGIQCDYDMTDQYHKIFSEANDWLRTLLFVFERATPRVSTGYFELGGTLNVIQYNYEDVKMRKLFNLADWGSSGSADIFFRVNDSGISEFSFWSCVR